MTKMIFKNR